MSCFKWVVIILTVCWGVVANAQTSAYTVKGRVADLNTNELLVGATLQLDNFKATSRLDGGFTFKNIPAGTYKVICNYIGYKRRDTVIHVESDMEFTLQLNNTFSELSTVTVQASSSNESDAFARKTEKNATGIMNIISANTILQSPDINIASVLQRVSGVSLERSTSGEGRYAIIRGMDQRYNYTLVNGIKIPSPDNKFRYVPMDIFPSDLVERVEVNKTLTPDMEADAVGGVVNMVMKNAPLSGLYLKASASAGLSQHLVDNGYNKFSVGTVNKKSPFQLNGSDYIATPEDFTRANYSYQHVSAPVNSFATLAIGNRFFDKKLGVMLGISYQNIYRGYSSLYSPAEPLSTDGSFLTKHLNVQDYSSHLTRSGGSLKLDYRINPNHTISFYNLLVDLKEAQVRLTSDTLLTPPRSDFGNGQVWTMGRSKYQDQLIYNSTLQGDHRVSDAVTLDWSAVYSKATNHLPDYGEYEYDGGINPDGSRMSDIIQSFTRAWWRNTDRDVAGYLNLHYTDQVGGHPYTISAGGLYRDKQRENYFDEYKLDPVYSNGEQQTWSGIDNFIWSVTNPRGSFASANNYTAYEKIRAAYAMAKIRLNKLEVVAGARMEATRQGYYTNLPETVEGKFASYNYTNILPSVNFKYLLNERSNLRLVYYSAINRPGFFEPVPYSIQGDDFDEHGNFNIKHATAQNIDLRYELFSGSNSQLMLGSFYKYIRDAIEYGFGFTGNQTQTFYMPANYGNARNFGFELVFEKYIGNWGVRTNYTYTNSSISSPKRQPYKDENSAAQFKIVDEKRPLQGQSAHLANAALLYKNTKTGTEIQFNWQFTGRRIALVSPYYGMDYWMKDMHVFDASGEQKIVKHIYLFAKVQNLFNSKYQVVINKQPANIDLVPFQNPTSGKTLTQQNISGTVYLLGLRFDLSK